MYSIMDILQPDGYRGVPLLPFPKLSTSINSSTKHLTSFFNDYSIKLNLKSLKTFTILCALLLSHSSLFPALVQLIYLT